MSETLALEGMLHSIEWDMIIPNDGCGEMWVEVFLVCLQRQINYPYYALRSET